MKGQKRVRVQRSEKRLHMTERDIPTLRDSRSVNRRSVDEGPRQESEIRTVHSES